MKLNKDAQSRLLRMAIALFPEYSKITISRTGNVKFFRRGIFKLWPRVTMHFLDLCLNSIPKRMSMNRYGNLELTATYFAKISILLKSTALDHIVQYLWTEFLKVKMVDFFYDYNSVVIPLPQGGLVRESLAPNRMFVQENDYDTDELKILKYEDRIIRCKPETAHVPSLRTLITSTKLAVASFAIIAVLNVSQLSVTVKTLVLDSTPGIYYFT